MAKKSKYETNVKPRLAEIEAWARDGVPEAKMMVALGVGRESFYRYKKEHSELSDILARTKEYVDNVEMVGAYKRRAEGYTTEEWTRVWEWRPDSETGEMVRILVKETCSQKHVPGDARAMENWLRLRQRLNWGDVQQDDGDQHGVVFIPRRSEIEGEARDV